MQYKNIVSHNGYTLTICSNFYQFLKKSPQKLPFFRKLCHHCTIYCSSVSRERWYNSTTQGKRSVLIHDIWKCVPESVSSFFTGYTWQFSNSHILLILSINVTWSVKEMPTSVRPWTLFSSLHRKCVAMTKKWKL